jgi:acyl carrier protein
MEIQATKAALLTESEKQKILSIIRNNLELENFEIKDETLITELPGVDSFSVMEILGKVEIELFINLGFESIEKVKTVADLYDVVANARPNTSKSKILTIG